MRGMTFPRRVAVLACIAAIAAACGDGDGAVPAPSADGRPARNAAEAPLLPTTVDALPDADAAGLDELLGQLRGTPVLVNVWASWCGPCRDEAPLLLDAADRYGDRVQFLGVDVLDARPSAAVFIAELGWTWPSVYDAAGDVMDAYGLLGPPVTLFFDADGTLVATWPGAISAAVLEERLAEIAA